jgi:hypothetical protein
MKLLSTSAKLEKSQNDNWLNYVLYLEPSVDYKSICAGSSKGCRASCLVNSGMMRMPVQTKARIERTRLYIDDREAFMTKLVSELNAALKRAQKAGKRLAVRLNGTSDLDWSSVYMLYPDIQFYEYTKRVQIVKAVSELPNVHITMSATEKTTPERIKLVTDNGTNVAMVFADKVPATYKGFTVIDGDKHDRRFEDQQGVIVGLKLKGTNKAKQSAIDTGFARYA